MICFPALLPYIRPDAPALIYKIYNTINSDQYSEA